MNFILIICCFVLSSAWLWRVSDKVVRKFRRARLWRLLIALFYGPLLFYLIVPLVRVFGQTSEPNLGTPIFVTAAYLWFPVLLPMTLSITLAGAGLIIVRRRRWKLKKAKRAAEQVDSPPVESAPEREPESQPQRLSRRQMIRAAAVALPPLTTIGLTAASIAQRGQFRVRTLTVTVPNLSEDLDGLTIAQLTDLHAGNFLPLDTVPRLIEATNLLQADLVVFTGDLIDRGQLDRLPEGLRLLRELDPRHGLIIIEGNHDLLDDSDKFEHAMAEFGDRFIVEGQKVVEVPSKRTPGKHVRVQFLGIPWGDRVEDETFGRTRAIRIWSPESMSESVKRVAQMRMRRPDAFPILLAHHPEAFDAAADAGLPLTLSGHTHGGQIMLTQDIGAGPLRFKYWNGVHERNGCQLVICNGIGAWFPLRVNAPAEILHITLRRRV